MTRLSAAFAFPWPAFVAAFLYYTLVTILAIGVENLPSAFLVAYGLPVMAYAVLLASRAVRRLGKLRVDIGPLPYPSLR